MIDSFCESTFFRQIQFHHICQNGVKTRRYLHRFYVEPLSPEYQNDSKTPVRFVRKMVGIYGQIVKILTVCPGENVLIRTKWTFSHFVRGKACFYGQIVWIGRFCPCKGRNRIPDSLWGMFEFSDSLARKTIPKRGRGYPTRELGWKPQMFWSKCRILGISNETVGLEGIESLFFVPPKTFSQNKTAVSDAFSTI